MQRWLFVSMLHKVHDIFIQYIGFVLVRCLNLEGNCPEPLALVLFKVYEIEHHAKPWAARSKSPRLFEAPNAEA